MIFLRGIIFVIEVFVKFFFEFLFVLFGNFILIVCDIYDGIVILIFFLIFDFYVFSIKIGVLLLIVIC